MQISCRRGLSLCMRAWAASREKAVKPQYAAVARRRRREQRMRFIDSQTIASLPLSG